MADASTPFAGMAPRVEDGESQIAAYMAYDQQGVAVFLGGGVVGIYHDNGIVMGNAGELGAVQVAVAVARLRAVADLIEKGNA